MTKKQIPDANPSSTGEGKKVKSSPVLGGIEDEG
jgi:hypothetical protein